MATKSFDLHALAKTMCTPEHLSNLTFCKNVLSKAITLMAEGADLSPLLPSVVKLLAHSDLSIKKAAGEIVAVYGQMSPDVVLLAVNTLTKDCEDSSPMTRGQALKVLCSLQQTAVLEHTQQAVMKAFSDRSVFVRRCAVLACLRLPKDFISESGLVDRLYSLLRDSDPVVVCNCLRVLDEVLRDEGGVVVNRGIAHYLLNRLGSFPSSSQACVLRVLCKYRPASEDEVFDIMNVTDVFLRNNSVTVVESCLRLFLHLLEDLPHLQVEVCQRTKSAIVGHLVSGNVELVYCLLDLVRQLPPEMCKVFVQEYRNFFCRHRDPAYLVSSKITFLPLLVNTSTYRDILDELRQHATDRSAQISLTAVKAIATISSQNEEVFEDCVEKLENLLSSSSHHVISNVLQTLQTMNLSQSKHVSKIISSILCSHSMISDESGTVAMLNLLDTYGCDVPDTPYIIEELIENYASISSCELKCQLLCTTIRVFFSRPAECQSMLGMLLELCAGDKDRVVQDTAMFYYQLLQTGFQTAKQVITGQEPDTVP